MPRRVDRREPTIRDVARGAGVSPATAARALGGYGAVSEAARTRVAAAARELGYRANSLARSMITGSTHTLGVVVADIENPFFARAVRGIADVAHAHGFEVMITNSDEDLLTERTAVHVLFEKRVDGLIIAPAASKHGEHLGELLDRGLPIVLIDRSVDGLPADAVVVDNRRAARDAVSHLVRLGHRRIAVVTGSPLHDSGVEPQPHATPPPGDVPMSGYASPPSEFVITSTADRLAGYEDALTAGGIDVAPELICTATSRREMARVKAMEALRLDPPATAFFTTDNFMTFGVLEGIREAGRSIPSDVSLVGFDDLDWTTVVEPPLTVVAQPTYDLGVTAATRLIARIGGDRQAPYESVLETSFQIRGSTAPPRT